MPEDERRESQFSEEEKKAVHVVPEKGEPLARPAKSKEKIFALMTVLDEMKAKLEKEKDLARKDWIEASKISMHTDQTALDDIVHVDEYRRVFQVKLARYEGAFLMWAVAVETYEKENGNGIGIGK